MLSENDLSTDRFAQLIVEKLQLVVEIKKLVDKQKRLIDQNQSEQLISLLAVKQQVVKKLQANDQNLAPFRQQDPDARLWPSPQHREESRQHADLCEKLFLEVLEIESYCEQAMTQLTEQTQRMLSGTVSAQQATNAYRTTAPQQVSQLDLTSD